MTRLHSVGANLGSRKSKALHLSVGMTYVKGYSMYWGLKHFQIFPIDPASITHESVRSEPVEEPCFDRLSTNGTQVLFQLCRAGAIGPFATQGSFLHTGLLSFTH